MREELERLCEAWHDAWMKKDEAFVEAHMAGDYVYVAPTGETFSRQRILEVIRDPTYRLTRGRRVELSVRQLSPDAALLLHRWQGAGELRGRAFEDDHRCVIACERRAGRWLIVYEQCSGSTT